MTTEKAKAGGGSERISWDEYFLLLAKLAACRSTCLSRSTGAVIVKGKHVMATGYNGSVPGGAHCTDDGECYRRKIGASDAEKLSWCRASHAEANAIAQAARVGVAIEGATIYTTLSPCFTCAKMIASAGIKRVVYELLYESTDAERDHHWAEALGEAGIEALEMKVRPEMLAKAMALLEGDTSRRRLKSE